MKDAIQRALVDHKDPEKVLYALRLDFMAGCGIEKIEGVDANGQPSIDYTVNCDGY